MKAKSFFFAVLCAGCGLFTGCSPTLSNLTPERIPQNASGIYTLSMAPRSVSGKVDKDSYRAYVVIDGTEREMEPSPLGQGIFDYDFEMPEKQNFAEYYYVLRFNTDERGDKKTRELKSDLFMFRLANRFVVSLESQRAPVGSKIAVMGRGFSPYDQILLGGFQTQTEFVSPNVLEFRVPSLPANQTYPVAINNGKGKIPVGNFTIDSAKLTAHIDNPNLSIGQRTNLVFGVEFAAPKGGLLINVTTDIPDSVILPEVVIPQGARTMRVQLQGGKPGSGSLFVSAPGFNEVVIPLTVR